MAAWVKCMLQDELFEAPARYSIRSVLQEGIDGTVCVAKDESTDEAVAIKKTEQSCDEFYWAGQTLRELRIIRGLQHENIVAVKDVFSPNLLDTIFAPAQVDLYVVTDLMETDMATILKDNASLTAGHCQFFLYQTLRGMKYIHSAGVIHGDLQPRNLLVNRNCDLKICDFSLAVTKAEAAKGLMKRSCNSVSYVERDESPQSFAYAAPEVLFNMWPDHSEAVDIWSIGCIFAEMLRREPMFAGRTRRQCLESIIAVIGTPSQDLIDRMVHGKARQLFNSWPRRDAAFDDEFFCTEEPLTKVCDEAAMDILRQCLRFNPGERPAVPELLAHPYFIGLQCEEDEPERQPLTETEVREIEEAHQASWEATCQELSLEALIYFPYAAARHPVDEGAAQQ